MRFSIKGLLIGVSAVAISIGSVLNVSFGWAAVLYGFALIAISTAVLGVIFRRGGRRAFWCGFAVFGWIYLLLIGGNPSGAWGTRMPTYELMRYVYSMVVTVHSVPVTDLRVDPETTSMRGAPDTITIETPDKSAFVTTGHSICLLVCAGIGGLLGRYFHATAEGEPCNA